VHTLRATPFSGVSFLVLAGVLWGTGGLLGRLLADATGLSPLAVATYRLTVGGLLLVGYLLVTRRRLPRSRAALARIAVTGALAALFQACYFTAVVLTSVTVATLVTIGSSPVLVLLTRPLGVDRRRALAVGLALVGLCLLVGLPADDGPVLAGAAFALLAAAGFTTMSLLAARPVPGLDDVTTTGTAFVLGGALLLPLATTATTTGIGFEPGPAVFGLLLALGLVPTALAYTCYFRGLRSASAGVGVLMALLEPLTAAVLSAMLLGDRLGVAGIAGGVLLGAALVLTGLGERGSGGKGSGEDRRPDQERARSA
jgi:DME family drug/metabolite transporter